MTAFNEILWIFLSQDNRNISVVNFIIGPIGGIIKSPGWRVIVMQFIFTSSNSSLSQKHQNCLKYLKHFEFDGCVTRSRVSLWLGSCSKLPYLIVWRRTETKETSFSLNLMIPQIPVVCCLKKCHKYLLFWMWHKFVTFVTVTVITWAGHTRLMTGPHTKYFPTYFYNPDIFCLPFISFLLTGCSQDQWMHNASPFAWHQKTAKKINECVCVIMTWVTSWHHPGPRGQVVVTRHRVSAGASWLYDS